MDVKTGEITPDWRTEGLLFVARLLVKTDAAGLAVADFPGGLINGELRHIVISHTDDTDAGTLAISLLGPDGESLLAGESVSGLASGTGGNTVIHKKLQYESLGGIAVRPLLLDGPQTFTFARSSGAETEIAVAFWFTTPAR